MGSRGRGFLTKILRRESLGSQLGSTGSRLLLPKSPTGGKRLLAAVRRGCWFHLPRPDGNPLNSMNVATMNILFTTQAARTL